MPRSQDTSSNSSSDRRYEFLAQAIAILGGKSEDEVNRALAFPMISQQVATFFDDASCSLLEAVVAQDGELTLHIPGQKKTGHQKGSVAEGTVWKRADIAFIKTKPGQINDANVRDAVQVASLQHSHISSLYSAIHNLYGPLLLRGPEEPGQLSSGVQQLLADLDTKLHDIMSQDGVPRERDATHELFNNVFTPVDEIDFWERQSGRGVEGEAMAVFRSALSPLKQDWTAFESLEVEAMDNLLEATQAALDDIWRADLPSRHAYPQPRMAHLLETVSSALILYVQKRLGMHQFWRDIFTTIRSLLQASVRLLERWHQLAIELTSTYWPSFERHPWRGTQYSSMVIHNMASRLEQILHVRLTHEELLQLVSEQEARELKVDRSFLAFEGINPLLYNPYTQPLWDAAMHEYERTLAPIEQHVSANFRRQVAKCLSCPLLLLKEFERFGKLIERPRIRDLLSHERETLLSQLVEHLDQMENEFDRRSSSSASSNTKPAAGKNLSPNVSALVYARQLKARLNGTFTVAAPFIEDLPSFDSYEGAVRSLQEKLKGQEQELNMAWARDVEDKLVNEELSTEMRGSLMEINMAGILTVNYSERLVTLLREHRQMEEMGFTVSGAVANTVAEGEKFYRYGVMLKKVANFYNSLESQIMESQKPMLLDALLAFEEVVSNPGVNWKATGGSKKGDTMVITWSNPAECQNYVDRLLKAADRLGGENRRLRRAHSSLAAEVSALMQLDLLRNRDNWKTKWQGAKDVVGGLTGRFPQERMAKWLLHWDQQLYKAVESGYQMGLESLNENLGEIKCDICLSNRAITFNPAFEELRMIYYREMKKFMAIPNAWEGFGNASIYRSMTRRNSASLVHVYEKAEELFVGLGQLLDKYEEWTALAWVDLDVFVQDNVRHVDDFEANLKVAKLKRKECERLPDFEKVDCFRVSCTPLKQSIEDLLQRLSDALMLCLRKNILTSISEVDRYLETGMEKLGRRPRSVEDISQAKVDWKELDQQRDGMKQLTRELLEKKRLLLQYAPGSNIDTTEVVARAANLEGEGGRWDSFEIALDAYNEMIEEQKEALRGLIDEQVAALTSAIDKFGQRWLALKPQEIKGWEAEEVQRVFVSLDDWNQQFSDLRRRAADLADNCLAFAMPAPRFDGLDATEADLLRTAASWQMLRDYTEELGKLGMQDWISFRSNIFALQDLAGGWHDRVKEKFADSSHDFVTQHLQEELERIKKALPALKYCRGEPFKEEHWGSLLQGKMLLPKAVRLENLTVAHFLSRLDLLAEPQTLSFVKHLQARAQGEVTIREAMQELVAWSQTAELKLTERVEGGRRTMLIRDWKELMLELGDKQSLLASLKESQFFKAFADQGATYESKLVSLDQYLQMLNSIQRKWVYLEPIFARGSLPSEQARFRRVDEQFRDIMAKVEAEPKLFNLADEDLFPRLRESVVTMQDQLDRCQKALADFLEEKRSAMPRFYFIGDDDLLEILGQAKNPIVIQSHLKKLFQGIHEVQFDEQKGTISALLSSAREVVPLKRPVKVTEKVEEWLEQLVAEMKTTLAELLQECLRDDLDLHKYPSQLLSLAENIKFTQHAEAALQKGGGSHLATLAVSLQDILSQYTRYDLSSQPLLNTKVKALVLDVVHSMDVVAALQQHQLNGTDHWLWRKQLRFYSPGAGKAAIRMSDAEFMYSFEYQGNAPKLVHTALTDRCYLTLTQAVDMGFGGNPYGPAGTGKTESVKALGQAFGRQVLVFNCDEGIDFQSMGRIFIGLVKCGAWGCFDEFNRLKEDQLSAISQQIQVIQDGIKAKLPRIKLLGRTIDVDLNAGIFVTLNPAGKGYGGRSKLPDNLKALFRPIAMGRPDNDVIAEVILYSEGFKQAKELASKIVSLFVLSRQLLSTQQHYDWGLRALKAVLNTGGKLIQTAKREGQDVSSQNEKEILIKAVRVNTLSKLTYSDTRRFLTLIGDVFPGVESSDIAGGELEAALRDVMSNKPFCLQPDDTQVRKMLQLREALEQRMGCVIVGPSGCGKSTLWRVLQAALIKCGRPVVTHVVNPKSMPRQQLLGLMDLDTREWCDGVLTDAARKVVKEPPEVNSWVVCDGDIDPEWIESLNSVLDDNHLLTLPNGERISFGPNVNFVFETHDLQFASPATVSRMGMIFLSDEDMNLKRLVTRWISQQPEESRVGLTGWIDDLFYRALKLVLQRDMVVETTTVGTVLNGLSQVADATSKGEFVCGLIRGLGANLTVTDRISFAKEVFQWAGERPPDLGAPLDCCFERGSFRSYVTGRGNEDGQALSVKEVLSHGVVPTISLQRTLRLMQPWIDHMEPFILVGPEGCGKNMIIQHALNKRKGTTVTTLHCNARTTAAHVITKIAQTCSLYSSPEGRVYRPRDGERLVLYLKDINLPKPDQYNSCMLIAFLQQLLTFGGFYDSNLEFLRLDKVQIVASMNAATTVGRHPLSTRFTAIVRLGVMDYPDDTELTAVYDSYLEPVLALTCGASPINSKFTQPASRQKLAITLVEFFEAIRGKFSVDDQRHYIFTPRDLTNLVRGLLRYDVSQENLLDCIANEANRIFRDRLVDSEAESKFDALLSTAMRSQWRHSPALSDGYYTTLTGLGKGVGAGTKDGRDEGECGDLPLRRVSNEDFQSVIRQGLMYYEREETELNLLLFPEVLHNVARFDRVLSRGSGQLLLVGRSGVGKRTLTLLVAYMLRYRVVTPAVTRGYNLSNFFADLKGVVQSAGIDGEHVVLFLDDHRLTSNAMVETLNSLLSAGEVPGLYTHEELESLLAPLRERALEDGTHRSVYDFFVSRVRRHLHVVLSMDATNHSFLNRCEANPALYTRCDTLWMGEWRKASMRAIPTMIEGVRTLMDGRAARTGSSDGKDRDDDDEEQGDSKSDGESKGGQRGSSGRRLDKEDSPDSGLLDTIVGIHEACKEAVTATPREYITFLHTWCRLHEEKRQGLGMELSHLKAGLNKLHTAAKMVDELSKNASVQQKELQVAQIAADRAMEQITRALSDAGERRKEVEELKVELAHNEQATQDRKAQIEAELASITPILESAKLAVGQIRSDHLNEIRSLIMPPEAIADVLSAVLMLLGINDTSWLSMKKFLMNRGVKDEILTFDAHRITPEIRKAVSNHVRQKQSSFEKDNITRVSVAAAPLAIWVKANIKYSIVLEKLEPLEQELANAESLLEKSQQRLASCEAELQEIDDKVKSMKYEFAERTREAERLRAGLERAQATLDKAQHLLDQLGGERERWQQQERSLRQGIATLPIQMLLAAAFTTYLAQAPEDTRERVQQSCMTLCRLQNFSFRRLMSSESQLLQWKAEGLPADSLSQENAIVAANAGPRVPFIIDPASAATAWLRAFLSKDSTRPLEVVQSQDARFTNQVELAVRFGKTLLVLDVDQLEPMLYPLARRELTHQGARWVVQVGDKSIDYNEGFRMVLVTRNPDPELPPDAAALVVQVNFTVTRSGLEGQLLGVTIQHEQPELEQAKTELLRQEESLKLQLAALEKELLEALATSEGNILDNTSLIESLTKTKAKAADIQQALESSAKTSTELDRQRESYRSFAQDGSKLYFLVQKLQALNNMYQFSLSSFITLFRATLAEKMKAADVSDRLTRLKPALESRVYLYVARAVFKDDRPVLAMHIIYGMYKDELIDTKQWDFFLGKLPSSLSEGRPKDMPTWAASDRATAFRCLAEHFPRLLGALELGNDGRWSRWATSPECERDFPTLRSVSAFDKVLVVQSLRPDRLQSAIQQFAAEVLRLQSLSPPALCLPALVESEASATLPILFLTSAGADPSKELCDYACSAVGKERYQELAMGGGQQELALTMLRQAAQAGDWLCLKNLHLVVAWLPTFEKEVLSLHPHPEFRLWLTAEPHPQFPPILLQCAIKLTFESPPGIKKTLQRIYGSTWSPEYIEQGSVPRAQLLFVLAWFHAIVQERRTYMPQGWTKFYEFSSGDLRAGSYVVDAACKGGSPAPDWNTIHGLMEDAIYGGRIDNPYDMRVMRTYLHRFFTAEMTGRDAGDLVKGVRVPASSRNDDYLHLIQQLPDADAPFIFGLPDNIERSIQRSRSSAVIMQLKALGTFLGESRRFDREQWRAALSPILDLWQRLSSSSPDIAKKRDFEEIHKQSQDRDPTDAFALMEDSFAADICFFVENSLSAVKKVVFGSGLLTPTVQATAGALLSDRIPSDWQAQWEGPVEHPQGWLRALVQRRIALARLCNAVAKKSLLNQPINLADLFNPGTFLNALRQQTSRQTGASMDQLKLVSAWEASRLKSANIVVSLEGLMLQGAIIAGSSLTDPPASAAELVTVPKLYIAFIGSKDPEPYEDRQTVALPLYMTMSREKFVVELTVPTDKPPSKWILAGTALFLTGDD